MKNEIGNVMYSIQHTVFLEANQKEISKDFGVRIILRKIEIIGETPKKYKIRFTDLKFMFNKISDKLEIVEKLYKKEDVSISGKETINDGIQEFNKYTEGVKNSDRISEYKKKAIIEAMNNFSEEIIKEKFNSLITQ